MTLAPFLDVSGSTDLETLRSRLVSWAHGAGFAFMAAVVVHESPPGGPAPLFMSLSNASAAYEASCALSVEDSLRDPVLRRLKHLSVPFIYDQKTYVQEQAGDLWEQQAAHGYRTGVAVALHLPGGRHFLLGVDRADPLPGDARQLTRMMSDLQMLAVYAQDAALRLLGAPTPPVEPAIIGERELEILRWTLAGKSSDQVARILSVSEDHVEQLLAETARKLGTNHRHASVLKAISMGLIH